MTDSTKLTILDFGAPWCTACITIDRMLEKEIMPRWGEHLALKKVDVHEHPELREKYRVLSVPTVVVLSPAGEVLWRRSRVFPWTEMKSILAQHFPEPSHS